MPRVNLLPVRDLARLEQAKHELVLAGLGYGAVLCLLLAAYQLGEQKLALLAQTQSRSTHVLETLSGEVKQIEVVKAKSLALSKKLAAIDKLRGQKRGPAELLAFFSDVLGELPRVWLHKLVQQGEVLTLEGGAMSQGDISAFQLALGARRPPFADVALTLVSTAHGEAAEYLLWTITVTLPAAAKAAP